MRVGCQGERGSGCPSGGLPSSIIINTVGAEAQGVTILVKRDPAQVYNRFNGFFLRSGNTIFKGSLFIASEINDVIFKSNMYSVST